MGQDAYNKIWKLLGLRYTSHPWHGIEIGSKAPEVITTFIEVIPSDTVKYEVDKKDTEILLLQKEKELEAIKLKKEQEISQNIINEKQEEMEKKRNDIKKIKKENKI